MAEEENEKAPEVENEEPVDGGADATASAADDTEKAAETAEASAAEASTSEASDAGGQAVGGEEKKEAPEQAAASEEKGKGGEKVAGQDIFLALDPSEGEKPKILKAKGSKNVSGGIVHVLATFNNTIVTVTDRSGNVIGWSSAGKMGFKGSRKSTAYAAQLVSQDACRQAMGHGFREADVRVKGPGSGRESAVRAVQAIGIEILSIRDVTPVPHNGCRPPKARRV